MDTHTKHEDQRCVELLFLKVRKDKVEEFVRIQKARFAAMKDVQEIETTFLWKCPFMENTFIRGSVYPSRDFALSYISERFGRERFREFVRDFVDDVQTILLEDVDISNMADVSETIQNKYVIR